MHWLAAERHFGKSPEDIPACIEAGEAVVKALRGARMGDWTPELAKAVVRVEFLIRRRERSGDSTHVR
jgi:hypothetical protein